MKFSWQMQHECAFVGMCPEGENMKKKMINEKINMETKLTDNVLPVVTELTIDKWLSVVYTAPYYYAFVSSNN